MFAGEIVLVCLALALGGILKGATGAGSPILAIPVLAAFFDVRFAIVIMVIPNLLTNLWQAWHYRKELPASRFIMPFVIGGAFGVAVGTWVLAAVPVEYLSILVAAAVIGYVVMRLARPDWKIQMPLAEKLAFPSGFGGGFLQGASGISAPISLTFLNAIRLERPAFIATIALYFSVFCAVQFVALIANQLLTGTELIYSLFALIPLWSAMPVGAYLARQMAPAIFDRIILGLLVLLSLKLAYDAIF